MAKLDVIIKLFNAKDMLYSHDSNKFDSIYWLEKNGQADGIYIDNSSNETKMIALLLAKNESGKYLTPLSRVDIGLNTTNFSMTQNNGETTTKRLGYATLSNFYVNKNYKSFALVKYTVETSLATLSKKILQDGREPIVYAQCYLQPMSSTQQTLKNMGFAIYNQPINAKKLSRYGQESLYVKPTCLTQEQMLQYNEELDACLTEKQRTNVCHSYLKKSIENGINQTLSTPTEVTSLKK